MVAEAQRGEFFRRPNVNIYQAMELTGVCRRTIYNWIRLGKVEYFRTAGGRHIRIYVDSLVRREE